MSQVQATEGSTNTVATETKAPTKADKAREVFLEMYGNEGVARKDIIKVLQSDRVGLTKAGAATYYQNMVAKRKAGKL